MRPITVCLLALAALTTLASHAAAAPRNTMLTTVPGFSPTATDTVAPPESTAVLRFVEVCPATACGTGRAPCPGDSLLVRLGGTFPNSCWFVRDVDLYMPPAAPAAATPWVRVIIDQGDCPARSCLPGAFEWERRITVAPRPVGPQTLNVALIELHCGEAIPPPPWPLTPVGFGVGRCDSATTGCFVADWEHPGETRACDLTLAPGESGGVDFTLRTSVGLDGLQGRFEIYPANGLRITNLTPLGPAAGMKLAWAPRDSGAEFVLFSDGPGHIPSTPPNQPPVHLLRVTLQSPPGMPLALRNRLFAADLLGATAEGKEVRQCPSIATGPGVVVMEPSATICSGSGCDINHDGSTDVRDLVSMVHCLTSPAQCSEAYDCNGDSLENVDDVMCCAMKILHIQPCRAADGCGPDSTPQRPDPNVRVTVGMPVVTPGGAIVPIRITGADRVGAARLALRLPADRWRPVRLETTDASWLTVVSPDNDEAVMGAIRIAPSRPEDILRGGEQLNLTLRLEPVDPNAAGGETGGLTADVSATDGVRLIVPIDSPSRLLPGASVELSENRPDPFTGETRFTLSLPAASDVDLGVYDLSGRRVAMLHHGVLAAGITEFSWNGRDASGTRLGGGVYFYRAVAGKQSVTKRMVYLGSR